MKKKLFYFSIFCLFVISIINLYNARYLNTFYSSYYLKQILWYFIGIIFIFILKKVKSFNIYRYAFYIYVFNLLLLGYVLFFTSPINGTKAWINLGFFSFQPSEFMKISLALLSCNVLKSNIPKNRKFFILIVLTFIPSLLVFLEPDTGAIIFYLIILIICLIRLKIPLKYYVLCLVILAFGILTLFYLYFYNKKIIIKIFGSGIFYRIERLKNFKTNNYQLDLSLISIYGSGIIRNGINNILIYVPEGTTDFIFSFIIGNFGIIMVVIILFLYLFIFIYLIKIYKTSNQKNFILCFMTMFLFQVIINISMNIGIIPIVGITLPFLSYGGSSILIYFIFLGIIFS